jgi:uncharacterized protein
MKLQPDQFSTAITAYGAGWVMIGHERVAHSIVIHSSGERLDWPCVQFGDLSAEHFAHLVDTAPELVLFGSGSRLRFPKPAWIRPLVEAGIGFDTMDTPAACRTFNIVAGEGRRVIAALLIEQAAGTPVAL